MKNCLSFLFIFLSLASVSQKRSNNNPIAYTRVSADDQKGRTPGRATVVLRPEQYAPFLLGEWVGKKYFVQKPNGKGERPGTAKGSRPPIYDSTHIELNITEVKGNTFVGAQYGYIPSAPDSNFFRATVEGWIADSIIHIKRTVIAGKLKKYPGFQWWNFESDFNITADSLADHIEGTPTATYALTGYMDLRKIKTTAPAGVALVRNYQQREKVILKTIEIQNAAVQLKFFDNKEVDGDSISIYINDKLVATHVRLDLDPFVLNYTFPDSLAEAQVSMFAENLGSIPPNTAAMQIIDGKKKYYIILKSNFTGNAVVSLVRKR
jgi:hypothetical protein